MDPCPLRILVVLIEYVEMLTKELGRGEIDDMSSLVTKVSHLCTVFIHLVKILLFYKSKLFNLKLLISN